MKTLAIYNTKNWESLEILALIGVADQGGSFYLLNKKNPQNIQKAFSLCPDPTKLVSTDAICALAQIYKNGNK